MTITDNGATTRYELDFGERLWLALRRSGVSVQQAADEIEVSRNAVGSWINGRNRPRPRDLRAFARVTGFPVQWLETGMAPEESGASTDEVRPERLELPTFWFGDSSLLGTLDALHDDDDDALELAHQLLLTVEAVPA